MPQQLTFLNTADSLILLFAGGGDILPTKMQVWSGWRRGLVGGVVSKGMFNIDAVIKM
jgi:hypothetical protein